ncbi:type IV toxin-antitoxin system AbiEi family antitoxin domain-containing protein [Isoptericola sp. 4D.3]|uniref:Type IV toxin-antitoxin system AbiEi family antitoxin domain-containing protein n=1 Tax=Isoptericola peretonis TaxID=2918523 RepID=A0ABT0J855_9MICO|nr:type IV toxin-antitoxin system AbiEi family antitoxin domain-containing protein [Isoptericola sp. 4D.3]
MRPLTPPPQALLDVAARQEGLVTTGQCEAAGMSADRLVRMVRQGRWVRLSTGVYDTDPVPVDDRDRDDLFDHRRRYLAWSGLLAFGPTAVAVGQAALALHAIQGLPVRITPEVMLPGGSGRGSRDGVTVRQFDPRLPTELVLGRRVAPVLHALAQAVPALDRRHAVALLDNAVHSGRISRAEVEVAHDLARGRRGVERTHPWWRLVDGRAESPLETWARLECIDAGIPPDDLQREIFASDGRFLGRGDLLWRLPDGRWFLLEMDGTAAHSTPEALYADRARQNALVTEGDVVVRRATAAELQVPGRLGDETARRLHGAGWRADLPHTDSA